ncbi:hypothetical protein B296_00016043, partial [Ensete ventricosum]
LFFTGEFSLTSFLYNDSDSDKRIKADKLDTSVISFHHVRMDMEEVGQAEVKKRPSPNNVIKSSLKKEVIY